MEKLQTIYQLAETTGLKVRSVRSLTHRGVLPVIRAGYRTYFYQPSKCLKALEKFEVKSITDRNGRQ